MQIRPIFIYILFFAVGLFFLILGFDSHSEQKDTADDHYLSNFYEEAVGLEPIMAAADQYQVIIQRLYYDKSAESYNINAIGSKNDLLILLSEIEEQQKIEHMICTQDDEQKQWHAEFVIKGQAGAVNMLYGS